MIRKVDSVDAEEKQYEPDKSEYMQMIERNIQRNNQRLEALGLKPKEKVVSIFSFPYFYHK